MNIPEQAVKAGALTLRPLTIRPDWAAKNPFYQPRPCCAADARAEHREDPYENLPADPRWLKEKQ